MTIYLDDETAALVKASVKDAGVSQSQWIADAIKLKARKEWPAAVRALAGAWPDFPTAEAIRKSRARDVARERF